jgi:hypothetical protein
MDAKTIEVCAEIADEYDGAIEISTPRALKVEILTARMIAMRIRKLLSVELRNHGDALQSI